MIEVACIGSRRITSDQAALCYEYGAAIAARGFVLKSGGADGADLAFMRGAIEAGGQVHCFLPWKGYNQNSIPKGCLEIEFCPIAHKSWMDTAMEIHPYPSRLSQGARLLMARNTGIIEGADMVIACPSVNRKGGTEQGIRLAEKWNIPLLLLS